ncbi:hypothetical protein ACET9D_20580, partial [Aeromonas veronii]
SVSHLVPSGSPFIGGKGVNHIQDGTNHTKAPALLQALSLAAKRAIGPTYRFHARLLFGARSQHHPTASIYGLIIPDTILCGSDARGTWWDPAGGGMNLREEKREISYYLMDYNNWPHPRQHNGGMPPAKSEVQSNQVSRLS